MVSVIGFGLHTVWPVLGGVVPFVLWAVSLLATLSAPRAYGYREPTVEERGRLERPWRDVQRRAGGGAYRLVVVDVDALNACRPFGRTVAVTSHAARSLPPGRLAAVLAHELGHSLGWRAGLAFLREQVAAPSRVASWVWRALWDPVVSMWRRAVAWHMPIGFVLVFLMAVVAAAVTVVVVVPVGAAHAARLAGRLLAGWFEARADAVVVRMGLGDDLLAAVEHRLDQGGPMSLPLVRRAERLRRGLVG
ncbi:peptidase M48-like protein [Actinomadura pelletieri DSM 43383]|uniref:Peptidase M48-like protein n=1 Tax=Actinomadura pelletieri DSM 43383 TaxID=1120940 RepID=A0A495QAN8_9ACTN|nr:M48 family metalloprotease [Actinomadura pelletieri]RKS68749.1 peptidase M48-like protein [Actinomadura pelletieri DSM 43383]